MRLSVHHITRFEFDQPSGHSIHDVRLTPKPATGQRIVSWRIDGPGKRSEWLDGHGNQVTTFSVAQQHDHVEIVVHGVYEYGGQEQWLRYARIDHVFDIGLHNFLGGVRDDIALLSEEIGRQFLLD